MELRINKYIPVEREKVFKAWVHPELLAKWSFPDGTLSQVTKMEAKPGGAYRIEHTEEKGTYLYEGYFKEFEANERVVQVDKVTGPDGAIIFDGLESSVSFRDQDKGTSISITQRGFSNAVAMRECEEGWTQCLNNLSNLLSGGMGTRPDPKDDNIPNFDFFL
jgi:uncharacterized protein YndB with AHSA1/START domain